MKAYLVTLLVVDHDEVGSELKDVIEDTKYPNRCISPYVLSLSEAEIGEWNDDHLLNETNDEHLIRQLYEWKLLPR